MKFHHAHLKVFEFNQYFKSLTGHRHDFTDADNPIMCGNPHMTERFGVCFDVLGATGVMCYNVPERFLVNHEIEKKNEWKQEKLI